MRHILSLAVLAAASTAAFTTQAGMQTIADTYIGSENHGYGDVIGSTYKFQVFSMDVGLIGTSLHVNINTNFAGRGDDGEFASATKNGKGIGYGDLFLSSSWNPYGDAPYYQDDNVTGTLWTYAFALDNQWGNGGTGTLYQLNGATNADNALMSDSFFKPRVTYRNGQEISVKEENQTAISQGTWSIDYGRYGNYDDNSLRFVIDLAGTSLLSSDQIALHWGMTCGNDTIEGAYEVPEPSILALLGLGMLGIGLTRRKVK